MTSRRSEVAVQQNGQETAIDAPSLEAPIHVDLDGEYPSVRIPERVEVGYLDVDELEDDVATDGGVADRREIESRGFSLSEEAAGLAMFLSVVLIFSAGELVSGDLLPALAMAVGGITLGYVSSRTYWGGRS